MNTTICVQWSLRDVESATMALYATIMDSMLLHTVSGTTGYQIRIRISIGGSRSW